MKRNDLTREPVGKTLIQLTLPTVVGSLSMIGFNLIDTYFVGQLGQHELAALSFTFPVILTIASLALGIGVGAMALISKSYGMQNIKKAARETTDSLFLALILVVTFAIIGLLTIDPVFKLLGADDDTLPLIREYMEVWYIALMFVIVPMVGNAAIRATGDTRTPSMIMLFAVLINAILDPLLIFGLGPFPALGLRGAALATAISRGFTFLLALYILYFREKLLTFDIPPKKVLLGCWGAILYISLPTAAARMLTPIAVSIVTAMIAKYGNAAVAGYGVGSRLEMLAMSMLIALSVAISPFVGQNLGGRQFDRIRKAVNLSTRFAIGWGLLVAIILILFSRPIASIFNEEEEVIEVIVLYLSIVPFAYGFQGIFLTCISSLNTLNKPIQASILSFINTLGIYIPLAYAGAYFLGLKGIFIALATTYFLGGSISYLVHNRLLKKVQMDTKLSSESLP